MAINRIHRNTYAIAQAMFPNNSSQKAAESKSSQRDYMLKCCQVVLKNHGFESYLSLIECEYL